MFYLACELIRRNYLRLSSSPYEISFLNFQRNYVCAFFESKSRESTNVIRNDRVNRVNRKQRHYSRINFLQGNSLINEKVTNEEKPFETKTTLKKIKPKLYKSYILHVSNFIGYEKKYKYKDNSSNNNKVSLFIPNRCERDVN